MNPSETAPTQAGWITLLGACQCLLHDRADVTLATAEPGDSPIADSAAEFALPVLDGLTVTVRYRTGAVPAPNDAEQVGALIAHALASELERARTDLEVERTRSANLTLALATNRDIATAMGIVMATQQCTREAAFERLRRQSQNSHRKLREIASDVIFTGTLENRLVRP
jgi:hypothetical protein